MPFHRIVVLLLNWSSFQFTRKPLEDVLQLQWKNMPSLGMGSVVYIQYRNVHDIHVLSEE